MWTVKNMGVIKMNKKLHVVGPHNCPARQDRVCIMNEEECHMVLGVECMFFHYELLERKRQLRLQKYKKERSEFV